MKCSLPKYNNARDQYNKRTQAIRDVPIGHELFVSYGGPRWFSYHRVAYMEVMTGELIIPTGTNAQART